MVAGSVEPPRLDMTNEDLLRSHVHAIWLAETGASLNSRMGEALDISGEDPSEPDGFPLWFSDVLPGGVVDIEAARALVLPTLYPYAKTMPVLADPGYQGAGKGIIVPFKNPVGGNVLSIYNRCRNRLLRFLRCRVERGFALLTERWTALYTPPSAPAGSATSSVQRMSSRSSSTAESAESH